MGVNGSPDNAPRTLLDKMDKLAYLRGCWRQFLQTLDRFSHRQILPIQDPIGPAQ